MYITLEILSSDNSSTICRQRALTCSCEQHAWTEPSDSSTPSTCVLTCEDRKDKLKYCGRYDSTIFSSLNFGNSTVKNYSKTEEIISERKTEYAKRRDTTDIKVSNSIKCDLDYDSADGCDESDRLTQLRTVDYMDIVDDDLKIVITLSGYPTSKIKLKHMQIFQRSLNDIKDMQLKEGLLTNTPIFVDYYINKGAIVCICKNAETRNWLVMIFPGLQERMKEELVLLKAKVKRMCLGVLKTPKSTKPSSAEDTFKLLQYFNPTLKTHLWKIYSRRVINDVGYTYFCIDRISREIIRGGDFKNVINFDQIDFDLRGTIELYCDYYLSDGDEDLSSIASRVRLLKELKSNESTPRNESDTKDENDKKDVNTGEITVQENVVIKETKESENISDLQNLVVKSAYDQNSNENLAGVCSNRDRKDSGIKLIDASTSTFATSERTESVAESNDNFVGQNSNLNIDRTRGTAYNRRTNYLQVKDELKTAIVLEGYPKNKLEGLAIKRLKQLFKDCLHKDIKLQRFKDKIIPRFHDVYLSNGAVIYICDSLETKNYLNELLPRFVYLTGFNLTFRDVKNLVRYTRVIMKLPMQLPCNVESHDILHALKDKYPTLNVDCWKSYSDVVGKRRREFGVDPDSLEVIKNPNFELIYKGEVISFRIIDRQKKEKENAVESAKYEDDRAKKHQDLLKAIYCPIDSNVTNVPLAHLRKTHYSDLIEDDLKMYVGPVDYPQTRITENEYCNIKKTLEIIILDTFDEYYDSVPKFYDIYLFDGVIFIICKDLPSKHFVEENIENINFKMQINLKCTEFRGVVGIIIMVARTDRDTDEVIAILQKENQRLRTKFWRKINTVRNENKLEAVLQIDKLSALIITGKDFNGIVDGYKLEFNLGYLGTVLKRNMSLQELVKAKNRNTVKLSDVPKNVLTEANLNLKHSTTVTDKYNSTFIDKENEGRPIISDKGIKNDSVQVYGNSDKNSDSSATSTQLDANFSRLILKVPPYLQALCKYGLEIIFELLQENNPGLSTVFWKDERRSKHNRSKFYISVDRQSVAFLKSRNFNLTLMGHELNFCILNSESSKDYNYY